LRLQPSSQIAKIHALTPVLILLPISSAQRPFSLAFAGLVWDNARLMKTPTQIVVPAVVIFFLLAPRLPATCQEGCDTFGNTFLGDDALINDSGTFNTAIGQLALKNMQSTATGNTAVGAQALANDTSGLLNTAVGGSALTSNTTGAGNVAVGSIALAYNTTGYGNIAVGSEALLNNRTGYGNTAIGGNTLSKNIAGASNIALGAGAGSVLTTGSNNIDIGNAGLDGESGTIRIGTERTHTATYVAGVRKTPLAHGTAVAVGITPDGQLGVRASSARFNETIQPMEKASEVILSLQPVMFRYRKELDESATPQFGLVAEQVEEVDPELVARDDQGKAFAVRYEEVNVMLLNEFLKEHEKVADQANQLNDQKNEIAELKAALQQQRAQLEDLSGRLKANGF
jgi:hypothetical protein